MSFNLVDKYPDKTRPVCPCVPDCPNRKAECRVTCEAFRQYDAERLRRDERLKAEINAKAAIVDYSIQAVRKSKSRARRLRKR